jgi:hypothetical protein
LLVAMRWRLPREDVGDVFEQLLTPAADKSSAELMLAAQSSERLVTLERGKGDFGSEPGSELSWFSQVTRS